MKSAVISACLIALCRPALGQSSFDGFGGPPAPCGITTEEKQWKSLVVRQLREHTPRLRLGPGNVTIRFQVDFTGRVSRVKFGQYDNNAQALVAAGVITSLKLPPPPDSVESHCRFFAQTFRFH